MIFHFGVRLRKKAEGMKLTRENYAHVNNHSSFGDNKIYTDEFCEKHLKKVMQNYDINMKYFQSLDKGNFNEKLDEYLSKHHEFSQVFDLNDYEDKSGYYIMVLDDYCQIYIGTSRNIKRRVMNHWSKTKQFDRLLFGGINNSILSIDSFRALDTTRVFAYVTDQVFNIEDDLISGFPEQYIINRTIGGQLEGGLLEAIAHQKTRPMEPQIKIESNQPKTAHQIEPHIKMKSTQSIKNKNNTISTLLNKICEIIFR